MQQIEQTHLRTDPPLPPGEGWGEGLRNPGRMNAPDYGATRLHPGYIESYFFVVGFGQRIFGTSH